MVCRVLNPRPSQIAVPRKDESVQLVDKISRMPSALLVGADAAVAANAASSSALSG